LDHFIARYNVVGIDIGNFTIAALKKLPQM